MGRFGPVDHKRLTKGGRAAARGEPVGFGL
jgi:hypothetical protein